MILFAITNTGIIILVVVGLLLLGLIGVGVIHYTKVRMEYELDELSTVPSDVEQIEVPTDEVQDVKTTIEEQEEKPKEHLSEIEMLLEQMQSDLQRPDREAVHTFEEEQEEKSIISYQELKAMKSNQKHEDEIVKYEQEQEEVMVSNPSESLYYDEDIEAGPIISYEATYPILDEEMPEEENELGSKKKAFSHSFSNSDFISPVYGKMDTGKLDYPKIPNFKEEFRIDHNREEIMFDDVKVKLKDDDLPNLEHTFDLGPLSEEVKKNDDFLQALKEFRNNLE